MKDTPAFPHTIEHLHQPVTTGMTLRDYFAAKALQGILSDSYDYSDRDRIATKAYEFADAMLRAREAV
tara:strand:+ start:426 stop:629 length:204 start_codon:yes stop_codon:yes gene_type:complete